MLSFFPQLVAGPIVRARDFIPQIRRPLFVSNEMFGRGNLPHREWALQESGYIGLYQR